MQSFLMISGMAALAVAGLISTSLKSDIQIQIFLTSLIGAAILFGLVGVLGKLNAIHDEMRKRP